MHERQAEFEAESKIAKQKRNPFNAKINEQSLANAKKKQQTMKGTGTGGMIGGTFARDIADFGMSDMDGGAGMLDDDFGGMGGGDIEAKLQAE